eukprot:1765701-Amphidinium_carterae.1
MKDTDDNLALETRDRSEGLWTGLVLHPALQRPSTSSTCLGALPRPQPANLQASTCPKGWHQAPLPYRYIL